MNGIKWLYMQLIRSAHFHQKRKKVSWYSIENGFIVPIFIGWTQDFNYSGTVNFNVMLSARYTIPSHLKVLRLMRVSLWIWFFFMVFVFEWKAGVWTKSIPFQYRLLEPNSKTPWPRTNVRVSTGYICGPKLKLRNQTISEDTCFTFSLHPID